MLLQQSLWQPDRPVVNTRPLSVMTDELVKELRDFESWKTLVPGSDIIITDGVIES